MITFNLFILEGKRGRKSKFATHDADVEYVKTKLNYNDIRNMSNKINDLRAKYLKALLNNNIKLANKEKKNLKELKDIIDKNKIVLPKCQRNWHIHEKDNCAYILVANTILQFDADFNPLKLPKLPIFKDIMTKFNVKLLIDDNLSRISLHISAIEMDEKKLKRFNNISFKKNDANWIKTKLKKNVIA